MSAPAIPADIQQLSFEDALAELEQIVQRMEAGQAKLDEAINSYERSRLLQLHCYSLVHDDLPAMDNSDLRRGRATVHKKFDDATAILAGDGLLTVAFEVLSHPDTHSDPLVRAELVRALAEAAGARGMVGGQML